MDPLFAEKVETLGLSANQRAALERQGVLDMATLAMLDEKAMDKVFASHNLTGVTGVTLMKVRAMCNWYNDQEKIFGRPPHLEVCTLEVITTQIKKMKRREDDSRDKKTESTTKQSDKPPQFSGKRKDWFEFRRSFRAYLSTMKNIDGIPLTYIIRTIDEEPEGDDLVIARIWNAPLQGETFNSDNYDVYQTLSSFMRKSTAFVHIQNEEPNGRGAWLNLLSFFQSHKAKVAIVANADLVIKNTKYSGEKENFRFEDYTAKFIQAFQEKKMFGEEVQGAQQVRAFVEEITHEKMSDLAMPLLNHEEYENDLGKIASQLSDLARIRGILTATKIDDHRKIGATSSQGRGKRKRSGGRGGRGGQGRGRDRIKDLKMVTYLNPS
ncbi:MAG: hypothetical protein ACREOZ_02940 [Gloeomargaritales cyanobacterium]